MVATMMFINVSQGQVVPASMVKHITHYSGLMADKARDYGVVLPYL
jgi:hypothetical protein